MEGRALECRAIEGQALECRAMEGKGKREMDREREEYYIDLAAENPEMLCSEAPDEILEACAAEAEPTAFMEEFLGTGHSQWILMTYGRRLPQAIVNNNILQLWIRACRLYTRRLMNESDPDWGKPFFSIEDMTVV